MITRITRAYVRHYRDNGQTTGYVEWLDHNGQAGRTEGGRSATAAGSLSECYGPHMGALFARAIADGITIEHETW